MAIEGLGRLGQSSGAAAVTGVPAAEPAAGGFEESLKKLVTSVEDSGADANTAVADMLGGTGEVHDAMIALQRAELSLQLTMQVRNKLVNAYQEIMRMPV
ncbi:MAG: flagellar hook-basal body complex protein FliE [Vicinamibacterales bacterium]